MDTGGFLFVILTGVSVIAISAALDHLWAAAMPARVIYLIIRLPGVVLHECAHIIGCLLTGARIQKVVLFSREGGSVTHSRPLLPYIGDVIISTAPLFLLPLVLFFLSGVFSRFLGCVFPVVPTTIGSPEVLVDFVKAIVYSFSDNLFTRFNGWFLLFLYLSVSLILSAAPSPQDMKNAAAGSILLVLSGILALWSGLPWAVSVLTGCVRVLGYGFTLGLVYGLVALMVSLPLLFWYVYKHRS